MTGSTDMKIVAILNQEEPPSLAEIDMALQWLSRKAKSPSTQKLIDRLLEVRSLRLALTQLRLATQ